MGSDAGLTKCVSNKGFISFPGLFVRAEEKVIKRHMIGCRRRVLTTVNDTSEWDCISL